MDPLANIEPKTDGTLDEDPLKIIKNEVDNIIKPELIDAEDEIHKMKVQVFKSISHKCKKCKSKFKYNCLLMLHGQIIHEKVETISVKCDFCQIFKNSIATMRQHIVKYHENQDNKIMCSLCKKSFTVKSELTKHKLNGHKPVDILFKRKCYKCDIVLQNKESFVKHVKEVHDKIFQCNECNKEFQSSQKYFKHMGSLHKGKQKCEVCNGIFATNQVLERHIKVVHENLKSFKCSLCSISFRYQGELNDHTITVHESRKYTCDLCAKSFNRRDVLYKHRRSLHLKIKTLNFECDICENRFKDRDTLQGHMKKVHLYSRYKCDICKKKFSKKGNFAKHSKEQHLNYIKQLESMKKLIS